MIFWVLGISKLSVSSGIMRLGEVLENHMRYRILVSLVFLCGLACEKKEQCSLPDYAACGPSQADTYLGDLPEVVGGHCKACLAPGMCFRFNQIHVIEPQLLAEYLNGIWQQDVKDYRLNILFCIKSGTLNADGSLRLEVEAGAAWHNLAFEEVLPLDNGKVPDWFEFVSGFTTEFVAEVTPECKFKTVGEASLVFHPGPADKGLICSAGDPNIGLPADSIPMGGLEAEGLFDSSCSTITAGTLSGCIGKDAACQICSFVLAPNYEEWNKEGDQSVNPVSCDKSYCDHHCGYASGKVKLNKGDMIWSNFGWFVGGLPDLPLCDLDKDGTDDAYFLSGSWAAVRVRYKEEQSSQ